MFSVYGYIVDRHLHRRRRPKAGPNLTTDSFIKAMDTMTFPPDMFGSAAADLRPDQAAGQRRVAPVADHRRQVEGDLDYAKP